MKALYNLLSVLLVVQVSAFQDCLFRSMDQWHKVPIGFAHGLKSNLTLTTDCVSTTEEQMKAVLNLLAAFGNLNENLLAPYHLFSYYMIAQGNQQIACAQQAQATQFNQRTNSLGGMGDLIFTMTQFPIEGFFAGNLKEGVDNQVWNAVYALWQGWNLRRSQTCLEVGYQLGQIYQAVINF